MLLAKILITLLLTSGLAFNLSKSYSLEYDSTMNVNSSSSLIINPSVVIEVTEQDKPYWYATNDGVMGGLSKGRMAFNHEYGTFTGNISLENNGGFSSVYRVVENIPDDSNFIQIDIEGDGQTYQLRLTLNIDGYRVAYKHDFPTQAGGREQIVFSLDDFIASYHGRIIRGAPPVSPEKVREVGFLIANKKSGRFTLKVHNIAFANSTIKQANEVNIKQRSIFPNEPSKS